jgi:hypothetical protein
MFQPSPDLAQKITAMFQGPGLPPWRNLGPRPAEAPMADVPPADVMGTRPDAHSRHAPPPGSPVDLEQVRVAVGEKLDRLLGTMARWHGTVQPEERPRILTAGGEFDAAILPHVVRQLSLAAGRPETAAALRQLGREFHQWVKEHPEEGRRRGLELRPTGEVVLVPLVVQPILPALSPLTSL